MAKSFEKIDKSNMIKKILQDPQPCQHHTTTKKTKKTIKENLEEKIKQLKHEVASLRKDHIAPPQYFLRAQRQILPAPQSKPLPQKKWHDNHSRQIYPNKISNCLHHEWINKLNKANKNAKSNIFLSLFKKLWKHYQLTKSNFKGQFALELTQKVM